MLNALSGPMNCVPCPVMNVHLYRQLELITKFKFGFMVKKINIVASRKNNDTSVRSFVRPFIRSFVPLFVRSSVRWSVHI